MKIRETGHFLINYYFITHILKEDFSKTYLKIGTIKYYENWYLYYDESWKIREYQHN